MPALERIDAGRRAFRLTLAGTVVSALGQGLTLPYLFLYLHDVLGAPLPVAGVVLAVASIVGLAATGLGGALGDRVGQRAAEPRQIGRAHV